MHYTSSIDKNYRTTIPKEIVEEFNLKVGDTIIWNITEDNKIILTFEKQ